MLASLGAERKEGGAPMSESRDGQLTFILNGRPYTLTRSLVEGRLNGVTPGAGSKHRVRVNDTWYPVKQAFAAATGIPTGDFTSHTARRHLAALGFELHGQIDHQFRRLGAVSASPPTHRAPSTAQTPSADAIADSESWHREENVQAIVVTSLAADGWRILSVADTASKERGIDIVAASGHRSVGVEVKGYPSRVYADPRRAGELKRTSPSTQAGHWYAQAILAAMRLRTKRPELESVIALPGFPRYLDLYAETAPSLRACEIVVWWVHPDGSVTPA
jgi:Holliday junction resolvase-like predicted endonuclease